MPSSTAVASFSACLCSRRARCVDQSATRPSGASGPAGAYRVRFTGIDSADDYIRLMGHLQDISVVRKVRPISAGPDGLLLELDLISGLPGFRKMIGSRGILVGSDSAEGSSDLPTFDLR